MTQTQSAPPPATWSPAAPPSTTPQPSPTPSRRSAVAQWFDGTPGRMRAFLIVAAAMSVLFGVAAAQGFQQSNGALQRAQDNAAQLLRIQSIHTNLVSANADATNAFLVGGLEPPDRRAHFVNSMAAAAGLIAEAATAQPADREVLSALNKTLITYAGLIEQARANNRQGLPIGSQYLKDANSVLQDDSLPLVKALVDANEKRVDTEFDGVGSGTIWILVGGLLSLVILVITLRWLARRTHRYVNLPIAAGTIVVLLTTAIGGIALAGASGSAKDTRKAEYERMLALSQARIAAFDARSNESLTLIARGSGDAFDKAYNTSAGTVDAQLAEVGNGDPELQERWTTYKRIHGQIRTLDAKQGNWDGAVAIAVGKSQIASSVTAFDSLDGELSAQLNDTSSAVQKKLDDARHGLPPIGWLGIPLGIVVALLVAWGVSQRLEEYR